MTDTPTQIVCLPYSAVLHIRQVASRPCGCTLSLAPRTAGTAQHTLHSMASHSIVQHSSHSTAHRLPDCHTLHNTDSQHCAAQHSGTALRCTTQRHSTALHNTEARHCAAQHRGTALRYTTQRHRTAQHSTAQHRGTALHAHHSTEAQHCMHITAQRCPLPAQAAQCRTAQQNAAKQAQTAQQHAQRQSDIHLHFSVKTWHKLHRNTHSDNLTFTCTPSYKLGSSCMEKHLAQGRI